MKKLCEIDAVKIIEVSEISSGKYLVVLEDGRRYADAMLHELGITKPNAATHAGLMPEVGRYLILPAGIYVTKDVLDTAYSVQLSEEVN